MSHTSETMHLDCLRDTGYTLDAEDGSEIEVWEIDSSILDKTMLAAWAKHFRQHYCLDEDLDDLRAGTGLSRKDYLIDLTFPDRTRAPGPSIRAGDFGEILITDYLEFVLDYWVPRVRYDEKATRNLSTQGSDILGFKLINEDPTDYSSHDVLAVYEVKCGFTRSSSKTRLQDAVKDSAKDEVRKAESLNSTKRRLRKDGHRDKVQVVERFQNKTDKPYKEISGAAALFTEDAYDESIIATTDPSTISTRTSTFEHPNKDNLKLIVFKGRYMMTLVHTLHDLAAYEA